MKGKYNFAEHEDFLVSKDIIGCSSFGDKKNIIKGNLCVSFLKEDYKYQNEIHLQIYSDKFLEKPRAENNGKWNRIEFFLSKDDVLKLISTLNKNIGGNEIG